MNERDTTPQGPSNAPDEPAPRPPNVRPAPSASPGEYVGKAQPIDPTRRRTPPAAGSPQGGRQSPPPGRSPDPSARDAPADEPDADAEMPAGGDEEPTGEPDASAQPPARPHTAPGRTRRLRQPSNMSAVDRVRRADFPVVLRGYDRAAVDVYVAEVAQLVAELEATQLPETVVQRALDEVGDETSAILRQAHETSEEITARSRSQAAGRLQRAEQEADGLRRRAEEQVRRFENDIQSIWQERSRLLEELRRLADEVLGVADDALDRIPPPEPLSGSAPGGEEATLVGLDEAEDDADGTGPPSVNSSEIGPPGRSPDESDTAEHSTGSGRPGA